MLRFCIGVIPGHHGAFQELLKDLCLTALCSFPSTLEPFVLGGQRVGRVKWGVSKPQAAFCLLQTGNSEWLPWLSREVTCIDSRLQPCEHTGTWLSSWEALRGWWPLFYS